MSQRTTFYTPYNGPPNTAPSPITPPMALLPLLPPPHQQQAPPLPPRPKLTPPPAGWTRAFHAIPAAYPRQLEQNTGEFSRSSHPFRTRQPPHNETKADRKARLSAEAEECVRQRYDAEHWTIEKAQQASPKGLWLCVERWQRDVPIKGGAGQTLVCTHANGMQKEHWHPVLHNILPRNDSGRGVMFGTMQRLSDTAPVDVDDIWLLDDVNHGASLDLNAGALGSAQVWEDLSRDVLNLVLHILPSVTGRPSSSLPWQLPWREQDPSTPDIKILGFGASFGGCALTIAAHTRPDLFHGLFLADPMVPPRLLTPAVYAREGMAPYFRARNALKRRDTWPSRAAAAKALLATPFYRAWHPAIFALTISHGLVPVDYRDPNGPVTLATSSWSETAVFVEPYSPARAWDMLPTHPVPIGFLMARDPERTMGEETTHELVWRPPRARNERCTDADHLVVQQNPIVTAEAAWRFLQTLSSGEWGSGQEEIRRSYGDVPTAKL